MNKSITPYNAVLSYYFIIIVKVSRGFMNGQLALGIIFRVGKFFVVKQDISYEIS